MSEDIEETDDQKTTFTPASRGGAPEDVPGVVARNARRVRASTNFAGGSANPTFGNTFSEHIITPYAGAATFSAING